MDKADYGKTMAKPALSAGYVDLYSGNPEIQGRPAVVDPERDPSVLAI